MQRAARASGTASPEAGRLPPEAERLSEEALETSRLVLELIHAAYPSRERESADRPPPGHVTDGRPLSRGAIRASIQIYQRGQATMGELASGLGMSNAWASRVVEELVRAGLGERSTDPADRRVVHVRLTPGAVGFVESAYRWRGEAVERALGELDPDGRAAVRRFLERTIEELQGPGETDRGTSRAAGPSRRPGDRGEAG